MVEARTIRASSICPASTASTRQALWFLCVLRDKGVEIHGVSTEHGRCSISLRAHPNRYRKSKTVPRWRQIIIQLGKVRTMPGTKCSKFITLSAAPRAGPATP